MKLYLSIFLITLSIKLCFAELRSVDKIRIHEAIKISKAYGNQIWKGFNDVPFTIILITDDYEYLMYHNNPTDDFKLVEYDTFLKTNIYTRKTQYSKNFLATFPAVNGVNCIVVGTPENTGLNSSEWIITLLHEHFHQYINTSPNYFEAVKNLDLAKGDTTGMWMLNYDFPYINKDVNLYYNEYCDALNNLYNELQENSKVNSLALNCFKKAKNILRDKLSKDDYNYFSFQLWQEGISRYTELKFLDALSDYEVSEQIKSLEDFIPFDKLSITKTNKELNNIKALQLNEQKRICFYSAGCIEGLVLDKINPQWRKNHIKHKFYLEKHL